MSESESNKHLPNRTTPTWEVELLISGVAVFAMLQLPGWLDDRMFALEPRMGADWRMVLVLSYIYAKSAVVVLAATFVLHLMLRAVWIALVGIHSVFPDGIRLDRMKMGPIQASIEQAADNSLEAAIERADNRASVAFAIGVMVAIMFTVICVVFPGALMIVKLAMSLAGLRADPIPLFLALFAIAAAPLGIAIAIDRTFGNRLKPGSLMYRLVHGLLSFATRFGMGPSSNPIMYVLATSDNKRRLLTAVHMATLLAVCGVGLGYAAMYRSDLLGNYGLFPNAKSLRMESAHYDDQRNPTRDRALPFVQGMVVTDPYLKLTVPYEPRRVETAMRACKTPDKPSAEQRSTALLGCLQRLHAVTLDGKSLADLHYEIASDPRTDRPALLAMIDVRDLPRGRHELRIARPAYSDRKPKKDDPDPGFDAIPFWR